jgi:tetratricopeptide (TPR) repeat protein
LALFQQAKTGKPSIENLKLRSDSQQFQETWNVLVILQLVAENNVHNAVHALLKLDRRSTRFPELATLRPALLTLAGQQAFNEGELECSEQFWQLFLKEQPFHPQLAVNLIKVLDINESYQELQRLITRLIKWLEQDFKQHPQDWPEHRRKETLAYAHCRLADTWVAMGRRRTGIGELKAAERIYPQSPEVKGRYGLLAVLEKQDQEAIRLLTQALEEGCRSKEVYSVLIDTWKKLGNSEAALEARRRFGKKFGDANPEADVEVLPWVNALSTKNYSFFSGMIQKGGETDPALRACRLFVDAVQGEPTASGKVSLDQRQLVQRWDQLLNGLSAKEQIPTLQAIALSLLLFAKREKGIAALINQYLLKLFELGAQQPTAREAHLVILALKERDAKKLQVPLQSYLATMPQPGNALAEIQLQLRRYAQIIQQNQMLSSYIEDALKREPQNPLLLLAKATTFPAHSAQYEQFQQQGFEIARRLQDAKALKAFRAEQEFLETEEVREFLPDPANLENFSMGDMDRLLEGFIRRMFGKNIPPAELKRMLPELKQMMLDEIMDFGEEEEEEEFGFGFPFGGLPFDAPPRSRRRRR